MNVDEARDLIERSKAVRDVCDLDLLVFFAKHPNSLLASEHLGMLLGYDVKRLAASLNVLLDAGIVRRSPTAGHAARLYRFAVNGDGDGWLPALVRLGSSRPGRLALLRALKRRAGPRTDDAAGHLRAAGHPPAQGPVRVAAPEENGGRRRGGDGGR